MEPGGAVLASLIEDGVDGLEARPRMASGGTLDDERPMLDA